MYFSFGNHDKGYYDESYRGYNGDDLIKELEKNNVTVQVCGLVRMIRPTEERKELIQIL